MLSTKLVLCAAVLMLGDVKASGDKPQTYTVRKIEQNLEKKAAQPIAPQAGPSKTAKDSAKGEPEAAGLDEVEVDGIKLQAIEANVVSYTNRERARYGLPPLEVDKELMKTAREHAAWMTRNQSMVHTWRPLAENIAMGQPHSSDVVRAWMNSPGHRANILNSGHRKIGVAAFCTNGGTIFWCQQFRR